MSDHAGGALTEEESSVNARVAKASVADLAYYLQERGLCDDFCAWYDEMPPIQRLLATKQAARDVDALFREGQARGYAAAFVAQQLTDQERQQHSAST